MKNKIIIQPGGTYLNIIRKWEKQFDKKEKVNDFKMLVFFTDRLLHFVITNVSFVLKLNVPFAKCAIQFSYSQIINFFYSFFQKNKNEVVKIIIATKNMKAFFFTT